MELEPNREAQRDFYRQRIAEFIARQAMPQEIPHLMQDIGMDDDTVS